jgi:predicted small lipoprotein YifL
MQDGPGTRSIIDAPRPRAGATRRSNARAIAAALVVALLGAGCGLKGSLTLPEKAGNVVIRPGPGGETAPAPAPEAEPLPPPELPPDTRGNTRD